MTARWSVEDPAQVGGTREQRWKAFKNAYTTLEARIKLFTSLPVRSLDRIKLQERLDSIGQVRAD